MSKYERQLRAKPTDLQQYLMKKLIESGAELIDSAAYSLSRGMAIVEVYRRAGGTITLTVVGNGESSTVSCIWAYFTNESTKKASSNSTNKTAKKASSNSTNEIREKTSSNSTNNLEAAERSGIDPTWEVAAFVDEYLSENA